jgi:hypothetical protein
MNNNTRLRVRVPKALYESIQAQLAKKQLREDDNKSPALAGDASSKQKTSSAVDDKFMASLETAKKLINSKITTPQQFTEFIQKFADSILSSETFADSLKKNSNYLNALKFLSKVSGAPKTSDQG